MLDTRFSMLDIGIPQDQIFLPLIEYRESNIEYLLKKLQRPATRNQQPVTNDQQLQTI